MEPSATEEEHLLAQVLAQVGGGGIGVLVALDGIGAQQVTTCQPAHHLGVEVLLVLVGALDVGAVELGIGEEVGLLAAVSDVGSAVELVVSSILQRSEAVGTWLVGAQIDVDDAAFACSALGNTRVVADLYLLDVLGQHLRHHQTAVARDGHVVETQLVAAQQVVVAADQQVGNELEDVHQRLVAVQVESPGVDDRAVAQHLDGGKLFPSVTSRRRFLITSESILGRQRKCGEEGGKKGNERKDVSKTAFHSGCEWDYTGAKIISFAENSKQM